MPRTGGNRKRICRSGGATTETKFVPVQYEPQFVTLPLSSATTP